MNSQNSSQSLDLNQRKKHQLVSKKESTYLLNNCQTFSLADDQLSKVQNIEMNESKKIKDLNFVLIKQSDINQGLTSIFRGELKGPYFRSENSREHKKHTI